MAASAAEFDSELGLSKEPEPEPRKHCSSGVDRARIAAAGLRAFRASQTSGAPRPQRLPDGTWVTAKYWGIQRAQLQDLFDECQALPNWSDKANVHHFVDTFVKPATAGTEMGYALMRNQHEPQQVTLMISHAWVENTGDFFKDVLASTWQNEVAFICFLSNFQGTPQQIDAQLGNDILKSPFTEILNSRACQRLLVVPNDELRENGQGLYSRLWCIWEMKVATDAGLPIEIVRDKSNEEFLLGTCTVSSKNARCGNPDLPMNKDERLIRAAIDQLPPRSARSKAVGCFVVCACSSYGSCVGVNLTKSYVGLLIGSLGGLIASTLIIHLVSQGVRKCAWHLIRCDGYDILDKVIRGSAKRGYSWRRITPHRDVPLMISTASIAAGLNLAVRYFLQGESEAAELAKAAVEGMGLALLLFFIIKVNLLGSLLGDFLVTRWAQLAASAVLLCTTALGSFVTYMASSNCDGMFGLGANIGFLFGALLLSICLGHWANVASNVLIISIMMVAGWASPVLWRECFLILCGGFNMLALPDWRRWQRLLVGLISLASVAGLEYVHLLFDGKQGARALNPDFCTYT